MNVTEFKVISLFLLFILTFFFCVLPLILFKKMEKYLSSYRKHLMDQIISCLNCFGGGVFLATCMLHLFPESVEEMKEAMSSGNKSILCSNGSVNFTMIKPSGDGEEGEHKDFLPFLVMSIGFLFVLFVEQATLAFKKDTLPESPPPQPRQMRSSSTCVRAITNSISLSTEEASKLELSVDQHEKGGGGHSHLAPSGSVLGAIMLVLALSLHSVFEGMAIGFEDSINSVGKLCGAVLIHKCIIAFTLGLNLIQTSFKWTIVMLCNFIFSVMSPVGIAISIIVVEAKGSMGAGMAAPVLQALASGTFLYVTFFEILPHEINSNQNRLLKQFFLDLGFALMGIVIYFAPA